jgi:DNA-binding MarR family transcriptional regulator
MSEAEPGTEGPEPRWLDEQEQHAWRAILRAGHLLRISMEEALDSFGVSFGEYELLSMLSEAPGQRMRMAALADLIVQSRSRVSHTASRLERRRWVQRTPSARDGRGVVLTLTPAGREVLGQLAPVHVDSVRRGLLDHLSREELLAYGEVMSRVVQATRATTDQASDAV